MTTNTPTVIFCRVVVISVLFISQQALAANTSHVDATFIFELTGAEDGVGGDESFNVEFSEIPQRSTKISNHFDFGGVSSSSASHTMNGLELEDDFQALEDIYVPLFPVNAFPEITVFGEADASATNNGDQALFDRTESTEMIFDYFGGPGVLTLNFDFTLDWTMIHDVNVPDDFSATAATELSVIAFVLDDGAVIDDFNLTPCDACFSGDTISLAKATAGMSTIDETSVYGFNGPINTGSFSLTIPDTDVVSSLSIVVETQFRAAAFGPTPAAVPVPSAVWLLGSALLGMLGLRRAAL